MTHPGQQQDSREKEKEYEMAMCDTADVRWIMLKQKESASLMDKPPK